MNRDIPMGFMALIPPETPVVEKPRVKKKTRAERFAESQAKVLAKYADTFRRLAG